MQLGAVAWPLHLWVVIQNYRKEFECYSMITHDTEVALFIDFENIHTSIKNSNLDAYHVDWRLLLDELEKYGRIAIRRAYTDWAEYARHQDALARFGIETKNAFGRGKNVSDIFLAVEAMEILHTHPEIGTYIIVSGDGDFSVMVHRLRNHHKRVIGVGLHGATAQGLVEACDHFIFYDDLYNAKYKKNGKGQPSTQSQQGSNKSQQQQASSKQTTHPTQQSAQGRGKEQRDNRDQKEKEAKEKEPPQRDNRPKDGKQQRGKEQAPKAPSATTLQELKQGLRQVLPADGEWINGATLIYKLRETYPNFDKDRKRLGFERFRALLEGMDDVVELRSAPGKGHMEVRLRGVKSDNEAQASRDLPPDVEVYDAQAYLDVLEQLRPRVTPSPHRPNIILKLFQIMQDRQPATLSKLKEAAVEEMQSYPHLDMSLVEEIIHQLYHTYSFEFERVPNAAQWERPCRFQPHIQRPIDLLNNCDLGLLKRLQRGLPDETDLDPTIIAYILYGETEDPRIMERTQQMLDTLNAEREAAG